MKTKTENSKSEWINIANQNLHVKLESVHGVHFDLIQEYNPKTGSIKLARAQNAAVPPNYSGPVSDLIIFEKEQFEPQDIQAFEVMRISVLKDKASKNIAIKDAYR